MDSIKSIGLRVMVVQQATLVVIKFQRGTSQHKMAHQDAGKVHCNCVRDHAKSVKRSKEKSDPSRTILQIFIFIKFLILVYPFLFPFMLG